MQLCATGRSSAHDLLTFHQLHRNAVRPGERVGALGYELHHVIKVHARRCHLLLNRHDRGELLFAIAQCSLGGSPLGLIGECDDRSGDLAANEHGRRSVGHGERRAVAPP